jgi:hypothetical protein
LFYIFIRRGFLARTKKSPKTALQEWKLKMDNRVKEWSSNKLKNLVKDQITKMFEGILDFSEVAVQDKEQYKVLRSKILKLGNDAIRNISAEIERSYEVEHKVSESLIVVKQERNRS